jgi:hypothetical protein
MENLPAPRYWKKARLKYLLTMEPQRVAETFQKDPNSLLEELTKKAQQAAKQVGTLKKAGNLADDQISEIVLNMVAPTDGNPPTQLPEDLEIKIREWFDEQA